MVVPSGTQEDVCIDALTGAFEGYVVPIRSCGGLVVRHSALLTDDDSSFDVRTFV